MQPYPVYPFQGREAKNHTLSSGTSPYKPPKGVPPPPPPHPGALHEKLALTIFGSRQKCSQIWTTIIDTRIKGVEALLTLALTQL